MSEIFQPPYASLPDDAIPCARLWERQSTHGFFLAGRFGAGKLLVIRNLYRRDQRDAEWLLAVAPGPLPFHGSEMTENNR